MSTPIPHPSAARLGSATFGAGRWWDKELAVTSWLWLESQSDLRLTVGLIGLPR